MVRLLPQSPSRQSRRFESRPIRHARWAALAVILALSGPAAAQETGNGEAQPRPVDPAAVGIHLDAGVGPDRVDRWRRMRDRAEAAYWAALPEEAPIVGLRADRQEGVP